MLAIFRDHLIPAAYAVLPAEMASLSATRLLLAIGWQESRFQHRKQIGGPAMGAFQFELGGGVVGVLGHPSTAPIVRDAMIALNYRYSPTPQGCYDALQHNDVLAVVFARLLLWTVPRPLPTTRDAAWAYYLDAWRPGKPHRATWDEAWRQGSGT